VKVSDRLRAGTSDSDALNGSKKDEGCRSLFVYCVDVLHFSEHEAYGRMEAARVGRRFPRVLDALANGSITLTTISLLAAHLTDENHEVRLAAAKHKKKREVEALVAAWRPRPAVANVIRKLPTPATPPNPSPAVVVQAEMPASAPISVYVEPPVPASRRPVIAPLSTQQYRIQLTISTETHDKLRRVQDLMRHTNPKGDPAVIFDRALSLLLDHFEKTKNAAPSRPRSSRGLKPARDMFLPQ